MTVAAPTPHEAAPAPARLDLTEVTLLLVAAAQLLPGLLAFLAPAAFYDAVASYPPENHHLIRDVGSWQIALGILAIIAWRRPALRVPALGIFAVQFTLHAVSHLIDVDASDPAWQGPVALGLEAVGAGVLIALFIKEPRT
jgi:hypothetical protein